MHVTRILIEFLCCINIRKNLSAVARTRHTYILAFIRSDFICWTAWSSQICAFYAYHLYYCYNVWGLPRGLSERPFHLMLLLFFCFSKSLSTNFSHECMCNSFLRLSFSIVRKNATKLRCNQTKSASWKSLLTIYPLFALSLSLSLFKMQTLFLQLNFTHLRWFCYVCDRTWCIRSISSDDSMILTNERVCLCTRYDMMHCVLKVTS